MQAIIAPESCPSCGASLEWRSDLLYCNNDLCVAHVSKRLEHWGKTLKIKGLGPRTIEKLEVENLHELYDLTQEDIIEKLSSEKLGEKLYVELQNSKTAPMNAVLPAFSIPLIGKSATEKLSKYLTYIFELRLDKCQKAGLGPKATENLMDWYELEFIPFLQDLPLNWKFEKKESVRYSRGTICISGKLTSFKTKAEAEDILTRKGYVVKNSLTKDVSILVNESGIESAKTRQAQQRGITIVTNLRELIGEINGNIA